MESNGIGSAWPSEATFSILAYAAASAWHAKCSVLHRCSWFWYARASPFKLFEEHPHVSRPPPILLDPNQQQLCGGVLESTEPPKFAACSGLAFVDPYGDLPGYLRALGSCGTSTAQVRITFFLSKIFCLVEACRESLTLR